MTGTEWNVGGIAGNNDGDGVISNSYTKVDVDGEDAVGGLVGFSEGEIKDSFALEREDVSLIGDDWGTQTGRVTDAPKEDMQNISLYTEYFEGYENLSKSWDIETITSIEYAEEYGYYPFLSWQTGNSPTWQIYEETEDPTPIHKTPAPGLGVITVIMLFVGAVVLLVKKEM